MKKIEEWLRVLFSFRRDLVYSVGGFEIREEVRAMRGAEVS